MWIAEGQLCSRAVAAGVARSDVVTRALLQDQNRIEKLLEDANIKLGSVVSNTVLRFLPPGFAPPTLLSGKTFLKGKTRYPSV
ncbi:MAG TPA: hypothetical protein VIX89_00410 [Bryobacteraceae bacterium]